MQRILNEMSTLGWEISLSDENIYELRQISPKGLDLMVLLDTEGDPYRCVENLQAIHSDFDATEEASYYLNQGNISPSTIQEEMEYLHQEIWELFNAIHQLVYA